MKSHSCVVIQTGRLTSVMLLLLTQGHPEHRILVLGVNAKKWTYVCHPARRAVYESRHSTIQNVGRVIASTSDIEDAELMNRP